ncbi:MAG TPA: DUF6542 domain-containing protein [Streptosporangiaceae bacterium]|nr:DUF6542 domain-containing protein [Streptosporangiaceae bacterium]
MTGRRAAPAFAWGELWPPMGARAAAVAMFAIFLVTNLAAGWLHVAALTGFGFAAGSAAAAGRTRRQDLLLVATTPPLIFLAAVTAGELITLHVGHVAASAGLAAAGIFLTLAAAAPWLFAGLAGALLIASVRGLPQCIGDLRAGLAGRLPPGEGQADGAADPEHGSLPPQRTSPGSARRTNRGSGPAD